MTPTSRGLLLHAFDAHCRSFARVSADRFEDGAQLAAAEIETLGELAAAIAADLADWRSLAARLDVARATPFDPRRAGAMVLETVFDEVLTPDAWRVLAAALDLTRWSA
jgi:hypothetical protein